MAQTVPNPKDTLTDASALPSKQRGKKPIRLFAIAILVIGGGIGYAVWRLQPRPVLDILKVTGRVDGYETDIGVKRSGRIESIAVREGALVKKGQQLIQLDDSNDQLLQEQLRGAQARVASVQSEEQQAASDVERSQAEIEQIESQIREAQLNVQQSQGDAQGRIDQARSTVAAALAQLLQAQAQAKQSASEVRLAKINRDRYAKLVTEGAVDIWICYSFGE